MNIIDKTSSKKNYEYFIFNYLARFGNSFFQLWQLSGQYIIMVKYYDRD